MIYNADASRKLLGCIFQNPQILNVEKYNLTKADFEPMEWHMRLYQSCVYLAKHGAKSITAIDLYSTVDKHPSIKELYDNNQTKDFVDVIIQLSNPNNLDYYYDEVRKNTILRAYQSRGFDVSKFENNLTNVTIKEIIDYYEGLQVEIKKEFYKDKSITETQVGFGFEKIKEEFKEEPMFGASTFSEYLNTANRGWIRGQLSVYSCVSGAGKTTIGVANLVKICCPQVWDYERCEFIDNPCYQHTGGLLLQFELNPERELAPRFVASISGVPAYHILNGQYEPFEEERVDKAIEILKHSNLHIVTMPNYSIPLVQEYIKDYVINKNVGYVVYDYIAQNSSTASGIAKANGIATRSDQVLAEMASALKDIAVEYNVAVMSFTQTNAKVDSQEILDAGCIEGSRAVQNKVDSGCILMPLRKKEEEVARMICESGNYNGEMPNRIIHGYKFRFGSVPQGIKIWGQLSLSTGRWIDCYVTDKWDRPLDNIQLTKLVYKKS